MSTNRLGSRAPTPDAPRSSKIAWAALVLALSVAARFAWLAGAGPALAPWQAVGVVITMVATVAVGVRRLGGLRTWALAALPFGAAGAISIFDSDPSGPVGAVFWMLWVSIGVGLLTAAGVAIRCASDALRGLQRRHGVRGRSHDVDG